MNYLLKTRQITVRLLTSVVFRNKKPFIEEENWICDPKGGHVRSPKEIAEAAVKLVSDAQASGYNLQIQDAPIASYGMGHTQSVIKVSNSYEHMRAIMDSPVPEQLPVPTPKVFNNIIQADQTEVFVDVRNGSVQRLVIAGPKREVQITTFGWPVLLDSDPGYTQLVLLLENAGKHTVTFPKTLLRCGSLFTFTDDGKDIVLFKSRGLGNVFLELFAVDIR